MEIERRHAGSRRGRPGLHLIAGALVLLGAAACGRGAGRTTYRARLRTFTVTAVPVLIKEQQDLYPFLKEDFGEGGVLAGKEVYAFQPSVLVAYRGDTLRLELVNPEDDLHTFALDGHAALDLPGQSTVVDTVVASRVGLFRFVCDIPAHSPFMYGQLVVLPPRDAPSGDDAGRWDPPAGGD
ncbi:MAG: cupredoxin domain-containing protein [Candidatus Palauibacterales bacterium]|nr:cupredoxin domain-containing protein [Candidatus Palauibacterales bacterium]MDP2529173.1 cupredoxin domain-containing protein [Candidatus Palauibacterales bacterium]MDP2583969.1 cupredoxin domain-containing protein [Candidatus Palauibacterales bacterium]